MRLLNASPRVRISGENNKAFDHLHRFVAAFDEAKKHHHSDFYKLAWSLPCDRRQMMQAARMFAAHLYNPIGDLQLCGFKEVRYGVDENELISDLAFLRELFPSLRVVFNVRDVAATVASFGTMSWETQTPQRRAELVQGIQKTFHRYHSQNLLHSYWMPFEEISSGSRVLKGMFDFLQVPFTAAAKKQLAIKLRD